MNVNVLKAMSPRGKLALAGSALGVILVAFLLFSLASKPSYSTIAAGVDPSQTGKMTAALDTQGIKYQLANNGTAIQVQSGQEAQARVALATQGLLGAGAGTDAWANFDKQQLGASDFQQQVSYQRALEQQIAQTIDQIPGAGTSSVQLTMPKDQLFTDQQTPATAAVLLGAGSSSMDPTAVRGIANLVASSVPNLKSSNVTITDSTGQMVWPSGDTSGVDGGGGATKPAAEARYNAQLESQLNAIVDRTLGPGKANVQVQSDLNVDSTSLDKLQYSKTGTPLTKSTNVEKLQGGGAGGAGGAAGAAANIPTYAGAAGGAGGNSNYSHNQDTTQFGVGKVVTHTKVAPGAVNRLDVSLVVDPSVPPKVRSQLTQAIATAAGVQRQRGDTISTSIVPFTAAGVAGATPSATGGILGYAKYAILGLASLVFLFFVTRFLRRRESADLMGEPVWLHQVESPRPLAELSSPSPSSDPPTEALTPARSPGRQQVEQAVQRDPERVAQTLRAWMEEGG